MRKPPTRRQFFGASAGLTSLFLHSGCSRSTERDKMRLSLSVRVAETFEAKDRSSMTIDQLIALAKNHGYEALGMRASQAGVQSPQELITEMRGKIDRAGLVVSMVTGDVAVPSNNDQGPDGLRNITPYLDLAEARGAPWKTFLEKHVQGGMFCSPPVLRSGSKSLASSPDGPSRRETCALRQSYKLLSRLERC